MLPRIAAPQENKGQEAKAPQAGPDRCLHLKSAHCCYCLEPFTNPVQAEDGFTYDAECIRADFQKHKMPLHSPLSGVEMFFDTVTPNHAVRQMMVEFEETHIPKVMRLEAELEELRAKNKQLQNDRGAQAELEPLRADRDRLRSETERLRSLLDQAVTALKTERAQAQVEQREAEVLRSSLEKAIIEKEDAVRQRYQAERELRNARAAESQLLDQMREKNSQLSKQADEVARLTSQVRKQHPAIPSAHQSAHRSRMFSASPAALGVPSQMDIMLRRGILAGNVPEVEAAIAGGANLNLGQGSNLSPPLVGAVHLYQNNIAAGQRIIEILVAAGADVNKGDRDLKTPMHWATYFQSRWVTQFLMEKRADLQRRDARGHLPTDQFHRPLSLTFRQVNAAPVARLDGATVFPRLR